MVMKPRHAVMGLVISAALALQPAPAHSVKNRAVTKMDFLEFAEKVRGNNSFELTVSGEVHRSFYTGRSYIHYETVAFHGRDDIRSTYRILHHTEEGFTVRCGSAAVDLRYSQVRTCISPAVERKYTREELAKPVSDIEKSLRSILDDDKGEALLLVEYGLEAGKTYHGSFRTESYYLPPRGRGGKPERREKTVLVISDRAFPNDCELTPLYKGWSY